VEAAKKQELTKLFDYVDVEGGTFVARADHTARFQSYLTEGDFNGEVRTLSLSNGIVNLVYNGLLKLQKMLTSEVCPKKGAQELQQPWVIQIRVGGSQPSYTRRGPRKKTTCQCLEALLPIKRYIVILTRKSPTPTPERDVTGPQLSPFPTPLS
jgi:hypothetical protein